MTLWDTAGNERFRTLTNNFYRNTDGILLVYSVEDTYTFDNIHGWISDASQHVAIDSCEWALVGNKCDMYFTDSDRTRIKTLREQLNIKVFYFVSAKTGEKVMEAFKKLIVAIHEKHVRQSPPPQSEKTTVIDSTVKLEPPTSKQKNRGSCCS